MEDNSSPTVMEIKGQGLLPIKSVAKIGFITSVFDKTSGKFEPVLSLLNEFQESDNIVYQHQMEGGERSPNEGLISWARIGVILPDMLQPPYSGKREMFAIFRMVDLNNPPPITYGFTGSEHPGLLWEQSLPFSRTFKEKGYKEIAEHRDEACAIALKIGIAVAMADGSLDDR